MSDTEIKILITGDFCPINRIEKLALEENFEAIFNDFIDVFMGNDLNVTDLECPLTESGSERPKIGPHQRSHPECIKILKYADIRLAAMANNHIMDYGSDGIKDTLDLCKQNRIDYIGVGRTAEGTNRYYSAFIRNKRIAVLNYADNEFISTPDGLFECNAIDPISCFNDISKIRQNHDYLIIIVHAGNEFYELPSPRAKRLYRYIIDLGADAIIAHHTHVYTGYEIYRSKPIFYGLGNFIYDWPRKVHLNWNNGYAVKLMLSDKIGFEIIPLKQNNETPGVFHLNAVEAETFHKEISRLNQIIVDDKQLEAEFKKYCKSVFPNYDAYIEPYFGKGITSLRKRSLFPKFMSKRKRLLLLNITRCESHRDVLIRMLSKYE